MKICVLSREANNYSSQRLREAGEKLGHEVKVLDTMRFSLTLEPRSPQLHYRNQPVRPFDAVIPRIGASVTFFGTAVVRQFEQMGVFTLAASHAIAVSRDKLRSLQALSRHDIGIPPTGFVRDRKDVIPAIELLGGAPVVIKVIEGTQGVGVILADTKEIAQAIVETLQSARQNVLIQKFVEESRGRDVRAFVVGGKVVAAMRRTAKGEEFRSNVHQGGQTEAVKLPDEYEQTAIRATQIMGLRVAGVDMLETAGGPQVLEVNSSPGLEGIEQATGVDVASAIIGHIEEEVLFPEIDVKQRLTLEKGYGVTEFSITPTSVLVNKTLAESKLRERDVRVLSIQRGSVVLPNPTAETRLLAGDVVLCFGKLLAVKPFIARQTDPDRRRQKA
jgi:ribosomal protein S6--L-glutamate ligase